MMAGPLPRQVAAPGDGTALNLPVIDHCEDSSLLSAR
jgi:hypothetical protein